MPTPADVVVEKGSEYILANTGPRELEGQGCVGRVNSRYLWAVGQTNVLWVGRKKFNKLVHEVIISSMNYFINSLIKQRRF